MRSNEINLENGMSKKTTIEHSELGDELDNSSTEELNSTEAPNENEQANTSKKKQAAPTSTRKSLQLPRRFFHCISGLISGTIYMLFLTHQQAIYILGGLASVIYILEQIRINYPNQPGLNIINKYFLRAEEHLKESAAIPYIMALLLTIITFPKSIALTAIFTLAIADPLSAIIGIKFGKHKIVEGKSLEGSAAFLLSTMTVCFLIFIALPENTFWPVLANAFFLGLFGAAFEMIPLKLDDNLTIPLFTATILWILAATTGLTIV